jgi:hypothetical protein
VLQAGGYVDEAALPSPPRTSLEAQSKGKAAAAPQPRADCLKQRAITVLPHSASILMFQ